MNGQQNIEDGDLNAEYADVDPSVVDDLRTGKLDGHDQDDDKKEYSAKVNKRIGKEVSRRKKTETERDIWKREAEKNAAELARMKAERNKKEKERIEQELPDLKKRAAAALEDGETNDYLELNEQIVERKMKAAEFEKEEELEPQHEQQPAKQNQQQDNAPKIANEAQNWLDENDDWINDDPQKFEKAKQISIRLMKEKGYKANDPDLYAAIDDELENGHDDHQGDAPIVSVPRGGTPPRDPNGPGSRNVLTRNDLITMANYGFDPDSPADRKNWLKANKGA